MKSVNYEVSFTAPVIIPIGSFLDFNLPVDQV